jgi:hypothetical protein
MARNRDRDKALVAADNLADAELAFVKSKGEPEHCETCGRQSLEGGKRSKSEQTARDNLAAARTEWREEWQPKLDSLGISRSIVSLIKAESG